MPARGFKQLQSRDPRMSSTLNAARQRAVLPLNLLRSESLNGNAILQFSFAAKQRGTRGAIDLVLSWSLSALLQAE
jgi:hypothetical protein